MATTEYYVDPSIAADSGSGTSGDPWGDLQYALNQITRNATDGDRINIKAGTDEVLTASLSLTSYGTPVYTAPLIFSGYTSTAGDGGIGGISGNGSYAIYSGNGSGIAFVDLKLHNVGSASTILNLNEACYVSGCELTNATSSTNYAIDLGDRSGVFGCYFHNLNGFGVRGDAFSVVGCTFENGPTYDLNACVRNTNSAGTTQVIQSLFIVDGATNCIDHDGDNLTVVNCSFFSDGGTGTAIDASAATKGTRILNNIIEGFSGTGGTGISVTNYPVCVLGYNAFYNNATNMSVGDKLIDWTSNDISGTGSLFVDASTGNFWPAVEVRRQAYPDSNFPDLSIRSYLDMGALQAEEI